MIMLIQSPSFVETVYSSIFKDIYVYSGILMHIQPHSLARNYEEGRGEASPAFFENQKKCTDFGKKDTPDCVLLWFKCSFKNM